MLPSSQVTVHWWESATVVISRPGGPTGAAASTSSPSTRTVSVASDSSAGAVNVTRCVPSVSATAEVPAPPIPIGSSPSLLGTQFAVQVMDFLPPANASEFCNSGGQSFMTSDTLVFTVQ